MAYVFISDLHLSDRTPASNQLFCTLLLACQRKKIEGLYILGDFFDAWIGDDAPGTTGRHIMDALRGATQNGLPVFLMHGNRDFLMGRRFQKQTGCRLLRDPHVLDLYGKRTLLMHGDSLCTADVAYQRFRRWSRRWLVKQLFLMKPVAAREAIASRYRATSTAYTARASADIMDVTPTEVENIMQQHDACQLIHGHTHQPGIHALSLEGQPAKRIVLTDWHATGGALVYPPDG